MAGQSDLTQLRNSIYPANSTVFSIIRGASEIHLTMPITELNTLSLVLESDLSTGYSWMVASAMVGTSTMQSTSNFISRASGVVTQQQVLTFTPAAIGNAEITLLYRRPFNKTEISSRNLNLTFTTQQLSLDRVIRHPISAARSTIHSMQQIQLKLPARKSPLRYIAVQLGLA
jgi:predicted secreted protein